MILIVGGTGVLGQRTARLLLAEGQAIRVMTRERSRAADLEKRGAHVIIGDLVDAPSLARACRGVDRVFAAAHAILGRGRYRSEHVDDAGHRALVDAARDAGVSRFVYVSALGASPRHPIDFFRTKYKVEQHLIDSGLPYVILRPSAFMEWHAHEFNGKLMLDRGRTVLLGSHSKRRNFVAASDVAHVATRSLIDADLLGRIVEIRGPAEYTDTEVAMLYAQAAGMHPRISHVPRWLSTFVGAVAAPFHPGLARIMRMAGVEQSDADDSSDANPVLRYPLPLTPLETFVRDQVARAALDSPKTI